MLYTIFMNKIYKYKNDGFHAIGLLLSELAGTSALLFFMPRIGIMAVPMAGLAILIVLVLADVAIAHANKTEPVIEVKDAESLIKSEIQS